MERRRLAVHGDLERSDSGEIVCVLRCKRHYYMAAGIHVQAVAEEFLQYANEEQGHADMIAERIRQSTGTTPY